MLTRDADGEPLVKLIDLGIAKVLKGGRRGQLTVRPACFLGKAALRLAGAVQRPPAWRGSTARGPTSTRFRRRAVRGLLNRGSARSQGRESGISDGGTICFPARRSIFAESDSEGGGCRPICARVPAWRALAKVPDETVFASARGALAGRLAGVPGTGFPRGSLGESRGSAGGHGLCRHPPKAQPGNDAGTGLGPAFFAMGANRRPSYGNRGGAAPGAYARSFRLRKRPGLVLPRDARDPPRGDPRLPPPPRQPVPPPGGSPPPGRSGDRGPLPTSGHGRPVAPRGCGKLHGRSGPAGPRPSPRSRAFPCSPLDVILAILLLGGRWSGPLAVGLGGSRHPRRPRPAEDDCAGPLFFRGAAGHRPCPRWPVLYAPHNQRLWRALSRRPPPEPTPSRAVSPQPPPPPAARERASGPRSPLKKAETHETRESGGRFGPAAPPRAFPRRKRRSLSRKPAAPRAVPARLLPP